MENKKELDDLVDIRDVVVDCNLSKEERIQDFIRQIKNPYHFKYQDIAITVQFDQEGESLEDLMKCLEQSEI